MLGQLHVLWLQSQLERQQAFLPGRHRRKYNMWAQQNWQSCTVGLMMHPHPHTNPLHHCSNLHYHSPAPPHTTAQKFRTHHEMTHDLTSNKVVQMTVHQELAFLMWLQEEHIQLLPLLGRQYANYNTAALWTCFLLPQISELLIPSTPGMNNSREQHFHQLLCPAQSLFLPRKSSHHHYHCLSI